MPFALPAPQSRGRLSALLCTVVFLLCELIARPFAAIGVSDDWSYIWSARLLAQSGHVIYNGWATAMIGAQLYAGAALIKLLGFSFTAPRLWTLFLAAGTTFLIQRTLARCGAGDWNASLGTLAVVLSPIYMQLSATFMTDVPGLFAMVLCLYLCVRALQAENPTRALLWIVFAATSDVVLGSSRQIAWLGVLVLVPSTLWLLRAQRRVLAIGGAVTLAGWVGVWACMHWFAEQPYAVAERVALHVHGLSGAAYMARQMARAVLDTPFLVLPVLLAFLSEFRGRTLRFWLVLAAVAVLYASMGMYMQHHGPGTLLQPLLGDWYTPEGFYKTAVLSGTQPQQVPTSVQVVVTALAEFATFALVAFALRRRQWTKSSTPLSGPNVISWHQLGILLLPITAAYFVLLLPRATGNLLDRYLLPPAVLASLFMVRAWQDFVTPRLPVVVPCALVVMGLFSTASTHDLFAAYRARVALADELHAAGVPDIAIDEGFEGSGWTELTVAGHVNDPRVAIPRNAYTPADPERSPRCTVGKPLSDSYRDVAPRFGISWQPDACAGPADIAGVAPVPYRDWIAMRTRALYAVRFSVR